MHPLYKVRGLNIYRRDHVSSSVCLFHLKTTRCLKFGIAKSSQQVVGKIYFLVLTILL